MPLVRRRHGIRHRGVADHVLVDVEIGPDPMEHRYGIVGEDRAHHTLTCRDLERVVPPEELRLDVLRDHVVGDRGVGCRLATRPVQEAHNLKDMSWKLTCKNFSGRP